VQKRVTGATDDRIYPDTKRFLVFCVADELHDIKRNGRIENTNTKLNVFFNSIAKNGNPIHCLFWIPGF